MSQQVKQKIDELCQTEEFLKNPPVTQKKADETEKMHSSCERFGEAVREEELLKGGISKLELEN